MTVANYWPVFLLTSNRDSISRLFPSCSEPGTSFEFDWMTLWKPSMANPRRVWALYGSASLQDSHTGRTRRLILWTMLRFFVRSTGLEIPCLPRSVRYQGNHQFILYRVCEPCKTPLGLWAAHTVLKSTLKSTWSEQSHFTRVTRRQSSTCVNHKTNKTSVYSPRCIQ